MHKLQCLLAVDCVTGETIQIGWFDFQVDGAPFRFRFGLSCSLGGCPSFRAFCERVGGTDVDSKTSTRPVRPWFPPFENREEPALSEAEGVGQPLWW
jgi:hypothetical protein